MEAVQTAEKMLPARERGHPEKKGLFAGKKPEEEGILKFGRRDALKVFLAAAGAGLMGCYKAGGIFEEKMVCECGDTEECEEDTDEDGGPEECAGPKAPATVQVKSLKIADSVTGGEFTEDIFADEETADSYVGGFGEGDGWTLRHEIYGFYWDGLPEKTGEAYSERIDRHGLEMEFGGELWEMAEISNEKNQIILGRRVFQGHITESSHGELPAGMKLLLSKVYPGLNENGEHRVEVRLENGEGGLLANVVASPGEIQLLGGLGIYLKVNGSNYGLEHLEDGARVSVYNALEFLKDGGKISMGANISLKWKEGDYSKMLAAIEVWAPTCGE